MFYAMVVGRVVTSVQDPGLTGYPLLLIQPLTQKGTPKGAPVIALDRIGVGAGETVYCETSREAGLGLEKELVPTDVAIVARVDEVRIEQESGRSA